MSFLGKVPALTLRSFIVLALSACLFALLAGPSPAKQPEEAPWSTGYMSRSRLLTGSAEGKLVVGVEIEMAQGDQPPQAS